jgi:hypothetical protein
MMTLADYAKNYDPKKKNIIKWEYQIRVVKKDKDERSMTAPLRYRKRPVEVEAWQYQGNSEEVWASAPGWARGTMYGVPRVGEWFVRDPDGSVRYVEPSIFSATYEAVGEAGDRREAVARIIDPEAWAKFERAKITSNWQDWPHLNRRWCSDSLAKADAILATLPAAPEPPVGDRGAWRAIGPTPDTTVAPWDFKPIIGWRKGGVRQWYRWIDREGFFNSEQGRIEPDKQPTHWHALPSPPEGV